MRYAIVFAPEAVEDVRQLRAHLRPRVRDAIERHLRHAPTMVSKSRIKRLQGQAQPQYRLRVDDVRVFYDVAGTTVEILAVVSKADAASWLRARGGRG